MQNILICGAGKEEVLFAAEAVISAALECGENIRSWKRTEYGEGPVCHIRTGGNAYSSRIMPGQADMILAMEPGEAVRSLLYLKKDGCLVLLPEEVPEEKKGGYSPKACLDFIKRRVKKLYIVQAGSVSRACGSKKALAAAVLGTAVRTESFAFSKESMENSVRICSPQGKKDQYLAAFTRGHAMTGMAAG